MDAFEILEKDHRTVEKLFAEFEALGDGAEKKRKEVVSQLVRELSIHAVVEEQLVYPAIRAKQDALEDPVLEGLEEHLIVKWTLAALDGMKPSEERYDAKVTVLKEMVQHHVEEEEQTLFPKARKLFDAAELEEMATAIERLKKVAPTHPHPRAPDAPPGNFIAGAVSSVLDRGRDLLSGRKARPGKRVAAKRTKAPAKSKAKAKAKAKPSSRKRTSR
jgi:hemerythrin superfamily protein